MKVLLSIKPEFANKIFDGSKRYEYRKTLFRRKDVDSIVVYASFPVCRVIGEFMIVNILRDNLDSLWEETKNYAGISREFYDSYFANKEFAYAIEVGNFKRYEEEITLQDLGVQTAPQSFIYIK